MIITERIWRCFRNVTFIGIDLELLRVTDAV